MKNKIIGLSIVTLSLLIVASGCGANNEKKNSESGQSSLVSDKKEDSSESSKEFESSKAESKEEESTQEKIDREVTIDKLNEVQTTNDLAIKVTNAELLDATGFDDAENKMLLKLTFEIQNNTNEDVGIGAGDFQIMNGDETIKMGGYDNFGDVVKPTETLTGVGSYLVPIDLKTGEIKFSPVNPKWEEMETLTWGFTIKE